MVKAACQEDARGSVAWLNCTYRIWWVDESAEQLSAHNQCNASAQLSDVTHKVLNTVAHKHRLRSAQLETSGSPRLVSSLTFP